MIRSDKEDILNIIIDEEKLQAKIKEIAEKISNDYIDKDLLLICVMNGSVFLSVDLIKQLTVRADLDFISVGSYSKTESTGNVTLYRDISTDVSNKDVLIIEDILDSGRTFSFLVEHFKSKNPKSLKTFSLLDKPDRRVKDVHLDYVGFVIPDIFIVGYGMDYEQRYRQLPFIGELKPEIYSE
ncbi:MAG: hypoxanthine phosphoribosyltransferase [Candidatus Sericytochromatia bacterium]